jgi:hypothetical protein
MPLSRTKATSRTALRISVKRAQLGGRRVDIYMRVNALGRGAWHKPARHVSGCMEQDSNRETEIRANGLKQRSAQRRAE